MDDIQEIKTLLNQIRKNNLELFNALNLIFRCGFAQKEVCSILTGDINDKESYCIIDTHAARKKRYIRIDGEEFNTFQNYLISMHSTSGDDKSTPIFPSYHGESDQEKNSGQKKMRRHCQKYSKKLTPKAIRSVGIKFYNEKLSATEPDETKRFKKIADRFRISTKSVQDQIHDTIKPAGRNKLSAEKNKDFKTMYLLDELVVSYSLQDIVDLSSQFFNHIENSKYSRNEKDFLKKIWRTNLADKISKHFVSKSSELKSEKFRFIDCIEILSKDDSTAQSQKIQHQRTMKEDWEIPDSLASLILSFAPRVKSNKRRFKKKHLRYHSVRHNSYKKNQNRSAFKRKRVKSSTKKRKRIHG